MNKKLGVLLSIGTAALLVTGCGSSDINGGNTGTEQPAPGGTDRGTQVEQMTAFTTEYLDGKTFYIVVFDDLGTNDGEVWNMASITFDNDTVTYKEYDTPDHDPHPSGYIIRDDGSIYMDEFDDTIKLTPHQTNDYLSVCMMDRCNTRLYFDEQKARDYRDAKRSSSIPMTTAMLDGKVFYIKDSNADDEGFGYLSLTFSTTELSIREIRNGNDETFSMPYTIENGKIRFDDEGSAEFLTLEDQGNYAWYLTKSTGGTDIWYLSKPADFPAEL